MTLQTSGAISLANIQSEFGGSNPISISEYYGAATGVPTSGQISFSQFYGKSALYRTSNWYRDGGYSSKLDSHIFYGNRDEINAIQSISGGSTYAIGPDANDVQFRIVENPGTTEFVQLCWFDSNGQFINNSNFVSSTRHLLKAYVNIGGTDYLIGSSWTQYGNNYVNGESFTEKPDSQYAASSTYVYLTYG